MGTPAGTSYRPDGGRGKPAGVTRRVRPPPGCGEKPCYASGMLLLSLLVAHADVTYDDMVCDGKEAGDVCEDEDGNPGKCEEKGGDCILDVPLPADEPICGLFGVTALPLVLIAAVPMLLRRRSDRLRA
jgi:hypothetical protein